MSQHKLPKISLDVVIGFSLSMIVGVFASVVLSFLVLLVPGTVHADDSGLVHEVAISGFAAPDIRRRGHRVSGRLVFFIFSSDLVDEHIARLRARSERFIN